jgi:hypothetical protein
MAKRILLGLILAAFAVGAVFAQEQTGGKKWYEDYAPGIDEGKIFINAGIGYGFSAYSLGIPPISVSADYKLPIELPITVGATAAISTWNYSTGAGDYKVDVTYTNIGFGVRGAYHFDFLKNLDTYAGLTLGYVVQSATAEYGDAYKSIPKTDYPGISFFLFGVNLGARYFFTKNIGAYLEVGYSGLQIASVGLSVKI